MRKVALTGCLAILFVILVFGTLSAQPMGPGRGGGGYYCPWMGGGGGYQQGQQRGWYCPWMGSQGGSPVAKPGKPLSADQAKAMVEQQIGGNPNLKAGKVTEKDGAYEVDIVTKDGSLVDKIQVNKQTGWFRSVY
jgi:hypothetical protein